jgi:hypothetical protein
MSARVGSPKHSTAPNDFGAQPLRCKHIHNWFGTACATMCSGAEVLMIRSRYPMCVICNEPVDLRTAKTNNEGQAVHEECYLMKMKNNPPTENPEETSQ